MVTAMRGLFCLVLALALFAGPSSHAVAEVAGSSADLLQIVETEKGAPLSHYERGILIERTKKLRLEIQMHRREFVYRVAEGFTVSPAMVFDALEEVAEKPDFPIRKSSLFTHMEKDLSRRLNESEKAQINEFDNLRRANEVGSRHSYALELAPVTGVRIDILNRIATLIR
ncbi:MAG: hypothetical protein OQJ76_05170 [Rhodospirillales bacterium]|nr:hypothetical protein [Rhodospirillales bacterium]